MGGGGDGGKEELLSPSFGQLPTSPSPPLPISLSPPSPPPPLSPPPPSLPPPPHLPMLCRCPSI
ncbi:MAG: hypothetical protein RMY29_015240 [Nostoc sp. CreGUA01]